VTKFLGNVVVLEQDDFVFFVGPGASKGPVLGHSMDVEIPEKLLLEVWVECLIVLNGIQGAQDEVEKTNLRVQTRQYGVQTGLCLRDN
jgi:hypothetical protein